MLKPFIYFKPWKEDKWDSIIEDPFPHPDKIGHLFAHTALTLLFFWIMGNLAHAIFMDLWVNTQVEIMDGTRPRRHLYQYGFEDQRSYELATIEGFSWKDWIAGILGIMVAFAILCAWVLCIP